MKIKVSINGGEAEEFDFNGVESEYIDSLAEEFCSCEEPGKPIYIDDYEGFDCVVICSKCKKFLDMV